MLYELWHIDSDEQMGTLEIPQHVDHTPGAKVTVKVKGTIEDTRTKKFYNAIEVCVCRMRDQDKQEYFALETNLPMKLLHSLEGFTPKILKPRMSDYLTLRNLFPGLKNRH